MKDFDIGKLLRIIDRRILILIVVGIVGIIGVQRFFVASTSQALEAAVAERDELATNTESLETRVEEILAKGTSSVDAMITRIRLMEEILPTEVDDLTFSAAMYNLADNAIDLQTVTAVDTPAQKPDGIRYILYTLTGDGKFSAVSEFIRRLGVTDEYIVTVQDGKISREMKSSTPGQKPDMRQLDTPDNEVKFSVTLMVWFDGGQRVVYEGEDDGAPAQAAGGAAGTTEETLTVPAAGTTPTN